MASIDGTSLSLDQGCGWGLEALLLAMYMVFGLLLSPIPQSPAQFGCHTPEQVSVSSGLREPQGMDSSSLSAGNLSL